MINMVVGGTTHDTARFVAKVDTGPVRIAYDTDSGMGSPSFSGSVAVDAQGVAKVEVTGLSTGTRYFWQVEDNGTLDAGTTGQFLTHPAAPGNPVSYSFLAATCAGGDVAVPGVGSVLAANRISNHPVFDTARQLALADDALFFAHCGDMHYYDLGSDDHGIVGGGSLSNYRRAYDDILLQPNQHRLYREVSLVHSFGGGGHDYGQPIGDARLLAGRDNFLQVVREKFPFHDLADPTVTAHTGRAFEVGRVLHVVTDENADRDPDSDPEGPSKTKLGASQKSWLDTTLGSTSAEVLIWLSGAQWERGGSANWGRYTTERDEIQAMLGDHGFLNKMVFVTGDRHSLQIVPAEDNPFGGFPIWHFASLDSQFSTTAVAPLDSLGKNRYGHVRVVDNGTDIAVFGTGYIGSTPRMWDVMTTEKRVLVSAGNPSHGLAF